MPLDLLYKTNPAATGYKERVNREDQHRRSYFIRRWPDGGDAPQQDGYDNDRVPALHIGHRVLVTGVTLAMEAQEREARERQASESSVPPRSAQPRADDAWLWSSGSTPALPAVLRVATELAESAGYGGPDQTLRLPTAASTVAPPRTGRSLRTGGSVLDDAGSFRIAASRSAPNLGAEASMRSRASRATVASMRSQISEAVQREVERSALGDYQALMKAGKDRERMKRLDMPLHLRTGPSPVYMGHPASYLTETRRAAALPVQMAVDPKWSTDLKRMNDRAGQRIEYERRLSAAISGSISPELIHMYPKKHISNPPTPYFRPGVRPH
mmetsp:Transcript_55304/g.140277  ORF Transcript_55304/g.140277 Transcript_55304/m.140277 type:complete len:328 (+) Transcript_55304:78-1061(+)